MVTRVPSRMITTTGVTAGSYTAADITVNESGQITSATSNSIVASGGGGPKISAMAVTDSSWNVLDDTAVDVLGGYIVLTGSGFVNGCLVYLGSTPANSVTFISSSTVRVNVPALSANTYPVYLINPDGGTAIRVPGLNYSANPAWQTTSNLPLQFDNTSLSIALVATDAIDYQLVSGTLPPGLTLNSSGNITGTVTTLTDDTSYTFTVNAIDAQNQDSSRTFSVTISVSDPTYRYSSFLITGQTDNGKTVLYDAANNIELNVSGDVKASNFTPFGTGWSNYFDGTGDYLTIPNVTALNLYNVANTVECWVYPLSFSTHFHLYGTDFDGTYYTIFQILSTSGYPNYISRNGTQITGSSGATLNQWNHVAFGRFGSTQSIWVNGIRVASGTITAEDQWGTALITIGRFNGENRANGYLSNLRVVKGTDVYGVSNTSITVPTVPLTAISNTSLLTCQSNRFIDASINNFTIARNGDVKVTAFNPFGIVNTGTSGSAYFDGTGDYIISDAVTDNRFDLTADFCVEGWFYFTTLSGDVGVWALQPANGYAGVRLTTESNLTLVLISAQNTLNGTVTSNTAPIINQWNHIAVTRNANTVTIWLNGVSVGSSTTASTGAWVGTNVFAMIGGSRNYGSGAIMSFPGGYISNFRVIKGLPVYTAAFTPPTTELSTTTETKLLTLQKNQSFNNYNFKETSQNNFVLTKTGNPSLVAFNPYMPHGWSVYFDGSDSLSIPSSANLALGTGDFTIELWVKPLNSNNRLISWAGTGGPLVYTNSSNQLTFANYGVADLLTTTATVPLNLWSHCAITRQGTTLRLFINGVLSASTTNSTNFAQVAVNLGVDSSTVYLKGYLSNVRVIKGTALYTSTFTPPTSILTNISGCQLLVCHKNRLVDDSSNNFAITRNGDAKVVTNGPLSATVAYAPSIHGGSAYFDGTGDYITTTYNSAFKYAASQDFCLETWAYADVSSLSTGYILSQVNTNNWGFLWGVGAVTSGKMSAYFGNGSTSVTGNLTDPDNFPLRQWVHCVWCRTGSTMSLFINGVRKATATNTNAINLTTDRTIYMGSYVDGTGVWNGNITGIRSVVGNSPYDATQTSITIPTSPVTASANTTFLTNFSEGSVFDATGKVNMELIGSTKISSVASKWGSTSLFLNGTTDYIILQDNDLYFDLLAEDFTLELWFNSRNIDNGGFLLSQWYPYSYDYAGYCFYLGGANAVGMGMYASNYTGLNFPCSTMLSNTWYHLVYTRQSGVFKVYLDGVFQSSVTNAASITSSSKLVLIGANQDQNLFSSKFNGYIQDMRLMNRYVKYTANFTPPQGPARLK
jgi:hypothetical protein